MKNKILDLVRTKPKHYSKIVKNDPEMHAWVLANTQVQSTVLAEMIYSAVYNQHNMCEYNRTRKFESFVKGYIGCGPAKTCQCVATQVSKAVTKSKLLVTPSDQACTNDKRRVSNLAKYGVSCVAQTAENKQKFRDHYADPVKVQATLDKIRGTYIEKYGVTNCRHLPEAEAKRLATILTKYNVSNISQIPSTKAKMSARMAEYKVNGHLIKKGYDRFSNYVTANYTFKLVTSQEEYKGMESAQLLSFSCNACNSVLTQRFHYGRGLNCTVCNPYVAAYTSKEEQAVFDYISIELGQTGYQSDRSLIKPYELDMVFPEHKIAVEYCGLYWHSELSAGKSKSYHADKMKLANASGYRLITIFSDEWLTQPDIVKSKLRNIFKCTSIKHHARKLVVREVPQAVSREFLNTHHSQGNTVAKINLGLYAADDQLVALMTFSNGRPALHTVSVATEYELVRFVTNGDSVVGGAGKLLSHFVKKYSPTKIISYADLRWSEGNLYKTLGFTENTAPTIGYWYVSGYTKREHRYNFTKKTLVKEGGDINKTEWEIMQDLGYDKIWDCGHQKYTKTYENPI